MRIPLLAAVGGLALLTSCAATVDGADGDAAPRSARRCFSVSQVENFRQGRSNQVFLRAGRDDIYELNATAGCQDLDFANRLAILPDGGAAGSRLCVGDWARVVVPGAMASAAVCRARISRKLTAEEIAALPGAHRP